MNEDQLNSFAETLARLAEKDHDYYINPAPTRARRAGYARRKKLLDLLRSKVYPERQSEPFEQKSQEETFRIEIQDQRFQQTVVSAPQCRLEHDLTNYIGVIEGFCDLLSETVKKDPTALRYVSSIRTTAEKAHRRMRSVVCTRNFRVGIPTHQENLPE